MPLSTTAPHRLLVLKAFLGIPHKTEKRPRLGPAEETEERHDHALRSGLYIRVTVTIPCLHELQAQTCSTLSACKSDRFHTTYRYCMKFTSSAHGSQKSRGRSLGRRFIWTFMTIFEDNITIDAWVVVVAVVRCLSHSIEF